MLNINMKPFTDNKVKITPELASDWIINETIKNNSIEVSSTQLNVSFTIRSKDFIRDIIRINLTMIGNKLQGTFLFDGDRKIFTDQELFEYQDNDERANRINFNKEDLIVGESYEDSEGNKMVFLGTKYIAKAKYSICYIKEYRDANVNSVTKITKKHLFIPKANVDNKYKYRTYVKDTYKGKLVAIDPIYLKIKKERVEAILDLYKERNKVVYFEDFTVTDPKWEIKEEKIYLI